MIDIYMKMPTIHINFHDDMIAMRTKLCGAPAHRPKKNPEANPKCCRLSALATANRWAHMCARLVYGASDLFDINLSINRKRAWAFYAVSLPRNYFIGRHTHKSQTINNPHAYFVQQELPWPGLCKHDNTRGGIVSSVCSGPEWGDVVRHDISGYFAKW